MPGFLVAFPVLLRLSQALSMADEYPRGFKCGWYERFQPVNVSRGPSPSVSVSSLECSVVTVVARPSFAPPGAAVNEPASVALCAKSSQPYLCTGSGNEHAVDRSSRPPSSMSSMCGLELRALGAASQVSYTFSRDSQDIVGAIDEAGACLLPSLLRCCRRNGRDGDTSPLSRAHTRISTNSTYRTASDDSLYSPFTHARTHASQFVRRASLPSRPPRSPSQPFSVFRALYYGSSAAPPN